MKARKMLANASYFAFTATPKNKTLEIFGTPVPGADGKTAHRPFHSYTMKQATQERFILDVLEHYTPVASYYKLIKTVEADPEFDTKRAQKKLRKYVEGHEHAVRLKAEIMVDDFHERVITGQKIGGEARAMVVTSGIERALHAIDDYIAACAALGSKPEKPASGKLMLRIAPEVHAAALKAAARNGVSLNKWAEKALGAAAH